MNDGSWNLRDKRFYEPATFTSFAVVDLAGGSKRIINGLLGSCFDYGLRLGHGMEAATTCVTVTDKDQTTLLNAALLERRFKDAIEKARGFFLQDDTKFFRRHRVFFRTIVRFGVNHQEECLVLPPQDWPGRTPDMMQACIIRPVSSEHLDSYVLWLEFVF